MGVIAALKKGFEGVKNLLPLMGILALFNLLSAGSMLVMIGPNPTPEQVTPMVGAILGISLLLTLIWVLLEGGVIATMIGYAKTGEFSLNNFLPAAMKFFPRLIGLTLVSGVVVMAVWFVGIFAAGAFIGMGGGENPFFNIIGAIIFGLVVIVSILLAIPLLIAHYVLIIKDSGVVAAVKNSIGLLRQYFLRTIGLFLLLWLAMFIISLILNFIAQALVQTIGGMAGAMINVFLTSVINGAIGIFLSYTILIYVLSLINKPVEPTETTGVTQI